ncbi:MAG TPA: hypothetical protein VK277_02865 [Acidimicrobiales bacterium]|nr:hypothetical protein [Acidimicrobiales bacterium]
MDRTLIERNGDLAQPAATDRADRSLGSRRSFLSIGSVGSFMSIGSVGSFMSIGSVGSFMSIGSIGASLSIGSIGSFLSIGSIGSFLSVFSVSAARARFAVGTPGRGLAPASHAEAPGHRAPVVAGLGPAVVEVVERRLADPAFRARVRHVLGEELELLHARTTSQRRVP